MLEYKFKHKADLVCQSCIKELHSYYSNIYVKAM